MIYITLGDLLKVTGLEHILRFVPELVFGFYCHKRLKLFDIYKYFLEKVASEIKSDLFCCLFSFIFILRVIIIILGSHI